jgi:hypothetical protein
MKIWTLLILLSTTLFAKESGEAKAVIQIWLWGGVSHLDTFDPKPNAGKDYTGLLNKTIQTNVPEITINASLPKLAKIADKYSIIRGMTHGFNAHETASYVSQTGHRPSGQIVYPTVGAVLSVLRGYERGYDKEIPPYVVLTQGQGRFSEAGFLGNKYTPFITGGNPASDSFAVEGIVLAGVSDSEQKERREWLKQLDTLGMTLSNNKEFKKYNEAENKAYKLMFGKAKSIFDLSQESKEVRDAYGMNSFGQSCLTARRLVESGCLYVTINYKGWDTHKQHFELMKKKLPELDQGLSTLLTDLDKRGLLSSTIVLCNSEFGRSPKVLWNSPWNGGRGHYGSAFSALIAGGGFKGGRVIGETDKYGETVVKRKVHPADVIRSIYYKLGLDPDRYLPNNKGIKTQILPKTEDCHGILKEIM